MIKKFYLKYLILSALIVISGCQQEAKFSDLNGNTIRLSDFRGKWLIVNYWANWCKPCYEEVSALNTFQQNNNDVEILGVSYDEAPTSQLKQWVKKLGINFTTLTSDPAKIIGIERVSTLPTTIIIDQNGKLFKKLYGPQTIKSLNDALGKS